MYIYDMEVHQRETFLEQVTLVDTDGKAIDLTGKTARAQVRTLPGNKDLLAEMSCEITEKSGNIVFSLSSEQTAEIPIGKHAYDLCIEENAEGIVSRKYLIGGAFIVHPSVTL